MKPLYTGIKEMSGTMIEILYTFSIKKEESFIHIRTVINLILLTIFFSFSASALSIQLYSPQEVNLNSSFNVSISLDSQEDYDIKISILNEQNQTISDIFTYEKWKSSFYYIKNSWPSYSSYELRAKSLTDSGKICVRARKSGSSSFIEKCIPFRVVPLEEINYLSKESKGDTAINSNIDDSIHPINMSNSSELINNSNSSQNSEKTNIQNNPIYLNSNSYKNNITQYSKTRIIMVCLFSLFALFILILLALDRL